MLDNYVPIRREELTTFSGNLSEKEFCKVAAKIGLHDWRNIPGQLVRYYEVLFKSFMISSPGDGRDL